MCRSASPSRCRVRRACRRWAAARQGEEAAVAAREIELLELRFEHGLPIREIAARWGCEAQGVHRLYQRARATFHDCLRAVVREQLNGDSRTNVDRECARLFELVTGE